MTDVSRHRQTRHPHCCMWCYMAFLHPSNSQFATSAFAHRVYARSPECWSYHLREKSSSHCWDANRTAERALVLRLLTIREKNLPLIVEKHASTTNPRKSNHSSRVIVADSRFSQPCNQIELLCHHKIAVKTSQFGVHLRRHSFWQDSADLFPGCLPCSGQ